MQKKSWMAALASHYEDTRHLYHEDRLMILFDIDGTILDMRYMVLFVLKAFDKKHKTPFLRISVKKATCFGFKVATHRSVATLVGLGWVSGFFESSFL